MIYQKYFKAGQKVQIRAKQPPPPEGRNELLSARIDGGDANHFNLTLPYGPNSVEQYPFRDDMPFELSADALGLGIKVTVTFLKKLTGNQFRVLVLPDLQMFQRRTQPRLDCTIGIRFTRGRNSLQKLRETWEKNASILTNCKQSAPLQGFNPCQLNISSAGIRFSLQPPAEPTDICLMLLDLDDNKPPVCALAEIIWTTEPNEEGALRAGMQFIDILEQDQKRIEHFIHKHT
ncbi:MAG: PilZ domain-containing protein [Geopsychrobacter sp.]|nr:PilZ domain-containing protein [Geopsychrobacter sp.]